MGLRVLWWFWFGICTILLVVVFCVLDMGVYLPEGREEGEGKAENE